MNPLYDQIFNTQSIDAIQNMQTTKQHHIEQQTEIMKAVKALHDYCAAARKITPDYYDVALYACASAIMNEMTQQR